MLKLAPAPAPETAHSPLSKFGAQKIAIFLPLSTGNPAGVYVKNLRASGRRSTEARLDRFAFFFGHTLNSYPWAELSAGDVLTARGLLLDLGSSKSTINMTLSALRGVARTQRRMHPVRMTAEVCAAICEVEGVKGSTAPAGRALREEEIASLVSTCARDRTAAGARDLALISLLYYQGLRRDEACRLEPGDWDARERRLRVLGKGDKKEFSYVESKGTRLALGRWLKRRGRVTGPLFCSVWRGGHIRVDERRGRPLSGDAVYKIVERRARARRASDHAPRTTSGAPPSRTCWSAEPTRSPCRCSRATSSSRRRRATTAAGRPPNVRPPAASPSRSASRRRRCGRGRSAHPNTGRRVGADAPAWDCWRGGRVRNSSRSPGHTSATSTSVRLAQSWLD